MRYPINFNLAVIALLTCAFSITASAQSYSGQASVARATINISTERVITTGLADTGELPTAGGNIALSTAAVSVPGLLAIPSPLSVGASTSQASGSAGVSQSQAAVANVNMSVLGNAITATSVSSNTSAGCPSELLSGSSSVSGLQINSVGVTVLGTPNQEINLFLGVDLVGKLVINEEIPDLRRITRNAMHAFVTEPGTGTTIEVVVGSSVSGVDCGGITPATNIYSGRGTSLRLRQDGAADVSTILADTGALPRVGGALNASTGNVNLGAGVLDGINVTTTAVASTSSGGVHGGNANSSQSTSTVNNLGINLLGGTVTVSATVLNSNTSCTASSGTTSCTGGSSVTNLALTVLGAPVTLSVTGVENETFVVPVGLGSITITLNGKTSASSNVGDITTFPLRVETNLPGLVATDIVVAGSHSGIVSGLSPTSAPVALSGRVTDRYGRGISSVIVTVTDGQGFTKSARTNTFGYYGLKGIPAGDGYIVTASRRGYQFSPRFVSMTDNVSGFDFSPDGGGRFRAARQTLTRLRSK